MSERRQRCDTRQALRALLPVLRELVIQVYAMRREQRERIPTLYPPECACWELEREIEEIVGPMPKTCDAKAHAGAIRELGG